MGIISNVNAAGAVFGNPLWGECWDSWILSNQYRI